MSIYAEPYAASGNIGDGGLRKLLGAPQLDLLETVIRESVQNCCDASELGMGPKVSIRLRSLNASQISTLKNHIFHELPNSQSSKKSIINFLNSPTPIVLEICDYNTKGLSGPTRADRIPAGTTSKNFISFMRNFGSNNNAGGRGGTYGFGKVSLYQASECQTILVDTCTTYKDKYVRRLMGCHLGLQHTEQNSDGNALQFTGRYWWGAKSETNFVDPLEGAEAVSLSESLGFPSRSDEQKGTSIMILDPCLEHNLDVTAGIIQEILLWYFWPRLTEDTEKSKKIIFELEVNGKKLQLPKPECFPPLDLFSIALKKLRLDQNNKLGLYSQRPIKLLGKLSTIKSLKGKRVKLVDDKYSIIPLSCCHIAVMRPVELVVRYFDGPGLPDESVEWAGLFIADESMDAVFALSEPPAHDDWQPKNIADPQARSFVNIAIKRIKETAFSFAAPPVHLSKSGNSENSFAKAAGVIGDLISTYDGDGAGTETTKKQSKTSVKKDSISNAIFKKLRLVNNKRVATFETTVKLRASSNNMLILVTPFLAIDGYAAPDTYALVKPPKILSISSAECSGLSSSSDQLFIGNVGGVYIIEVLIPAGYASTIKLELSERESNE